MAAIAPDVSLASQRVKEFFLGRQPILNRDQSLAAYELLFRSAADGPANVTDDLYATASVIAHAAELGMENVIGTTRGFLNVDAAVLLSDIVHFLPKDRVVLEILETVKVNDRILARVKELKQAGYLFALDDVTSDSEDVNKLLPLVDIVKIDITGMAQAELSRLAIRFKSEQKSLLAEKVENLEQFQRCLDLQFDCFQGYYFAKPHILSGKKLSPSQMAIMQLLTLIVADADSADIERAIKQDASLGFSLLRLVNTPAVGVTQRIDSLSQAVLVLGRRRLQRWLQILLYAQPAMAAPATAPLLLLATTRGKLLELMTEKLQPGNRSRADVAFTVGIMSLMDTLFGMQMDKILEQIHVADDVGQALLFRKGLFGDMLTLVESVENVKQSGPMVPPLLKKLRLSSEQFYALQLAAFEWSDRISRSAA